LKIKGSAVETIEMEVTDSKQVDAAATRVMEEMGRVDILVCTPASRDRKPRRKTSPTSIG